MKRQLNKAAVNVADSQCGDQDCHECLSSMRWKPQNVLYLNGKH